MNCAMEMMARTRMAKAQRRARIARVGLIVVSTDRGLCGPLNSRLLMRCAESLNDRQRGGMEADVIGARGAGPLMRHGANIVARTAALSADLHFESFFGAMTVPLSGFLAGQFDEVYVAYNHLSSALSYEPRIDRILPLGEIRREGDEGQHAAGAVRTEYLYEPSPKPVVDALLLRYVEALIYQAVAENNACEQCARMFAMQTATENADRVIRDLRHLYQKTRQAQITTELCEIVGGAARRSSGAAARPPRKRQRQKRRQRDSTVQRIQIQRNDLDRHLLAGVVAADSAEPDFATTDHHALIAGEQRRIGLMRDQIDQLRRKDRVVMGDEVALRTQRHFLAVQRDGDRIFDHARDGRFVGARHGLLQLVEELAVRHVGTEQKVHPRIDGLIGLGVALRIALCDREWHEAECEGDAEHSARDRSNVSRASV